MKNYRLVITYQIHQLSHQEGVLYDELNLIADKNEVDANYITDLGNIITMIEDLPKELDDNI